MVDQELDTRVRLAAFQFLDATTQLRGDVLPRDLLADGFQFEGTRVHLVGPQGIFKPKILPEIPISITTVPVVQGQPRPYDDGIDASGLLLYRYRGSDLQHHENVGLRLAMHRRKPLIYFFGVVPGQYMPIWPVFVVGDDPGSLSFSIAVDEKKVLFPQDLDTQDMVAEGRRAYITGLTRQRLHQQTFRQRVLRAYQNCCAICRLRHVELLEAAHILPDTHPKGDPIVPNGISLCRLHHAAFDRHILGISPEFRISLRADILEEIDGPMLVHGLQGFQGKNILIPHASQLRPNRDFLAERFELFKIAS